MTALGPDNKILKELSPGSFIYVMDRALSAPSCREMIALFESRTEQHYAGRIGQLADDQSSIKQSTDLRISGRSDWAAFDDLLRASLLEALKQICQLHPFFASNRMMDIGYNMQRTQSGQFYHWHIDSGPGEFSKRQLVAIWYLNGPAEGFSGGQTEFHFQDISVTPETGKLILFPPFWTHPHRGKTVSQGVKYLVTTWICTAD